jgi:hypothetical protein
MGLINPIFFMKTKINLENVVTLIIGLSIMYGIKYVNDNYKFTIKEDINNQHYTINNKYLEIKKLNDFEKEYRRLLK